MRGNSAMRSAGNAPISARMRTVPPNNTISHPPLRSTSATAVETSSARIAVAHCFEQARRGRQTRRPRAHAVLGCRLPIRAGARADTRAADDAGGTSTARHLAGPESVPAGLPRSGAATRTRCRLPRQPAPDSAHRGWPLATAHAAPPVAVRRAPARLRYSATSVVRPENASRSEERSGFASSHSLASCRATGQPSVRASSRSMLLGRKRWQQRARFLGLKAQRLRVDLE